MYKDPESLKIMCVQESLEPGGTQKTQYRMADVDEEVTKVRT